MTEDDQEPHRPGPALKQAIHVARERVGMTSDTQLALRAGVSYDTLMNWFAERTTPRPAELKKVADVLGVRLVDLMDVWDGRDPQAPALEEVLWELVGELRAGLLEQRMARVAIEESTSAILRALGAGTQPGRAPRDTHVENGPGARAGTGRR